MQAVGGARRGGFLADRFELVEGLADLLQLIGAACPEVLAAAETGDFAQGRFVEVQARAQAQHGGHARLRRLGTDADG